MFFWLFIGVLLITFYLLKWNFSQAILAGIALSTTSVAVVYSVMFETGMNETPLGRIILAACFVNDLATVIALSLFFGKLNYIQFLFYLALVLFVPFVFYFYLKFVRNYPTYIIGALLSKQLINDKESSKKVRVTTNVNFVFY